MKNNHSRQQVSTDLLIIGAGPAGSAAALAATKAGIDCLILERAESFPRDKTCGDGLTPRAIAQLQDLKLADKLLDTYSSRGLSLHGFGGNVEVPWAFPGSAFPGVGSACKRVDLDSMLVNAATDSGARLLTGQHAHGVEVDTRGRVVAVTTDSLTVQCRRLILAEGVRSTLGSQLGLRWHRDTVYGIAARAYAPSPRHDDPWIHSHLELRDRSTDATESSAGSPEGGEVWRRLKNWKPTTTTGTIQPGYGWIFPLGTGEVNIGCGALSTSSRPARINTKKLLRSYADQVREEWGLGEVHTIASALLPMGGAVSGVSGPNWAAIGDTAACVNPLNGEGIDYALETGRAAVEMMAELPPSRMDLTLRWPDYLRDHYGRSFSLARRAAIMLTYPQALPLAGPVALRGPAAPVLMRAIARLMGNLVTDSDADAIARAWRAAGSLSLRLPEPAPLWGTRRF